ncbi:MAG: isochorismatase family protein [Phycisphaerae bacterium]
MKLDRILMDIETQRDLFLPKNPAYTAQAGRAAPNIYKLFRWAKQNEVPVISTALRVRPGHLGPFGDQPHLIEQTAGETKLPRTILKSHIDLGLRNDFDLPRDLFDRYQQAIFEKRETDIFQHGKAERLLTELPNGTVVVCGAGVAQGIVEATVGLRSRGFSVVLAEDAVVDFDDPGAEMAYLRMQAKGVFFAPTSQIIHPSTKLRAAPFKQERPAVTRNR